LRFLLLSGGTFDPVGYAIDRIAMLPRPAPGAYASDIAD
jgi:hypothetical protein